MYDRAAFTAIGLNESDENRGAAVRDHGFLGLQGCRLLQTGGKAGFPYVEADRIIFFFLLKASEFRATGRKYRELRKAPYSYL
jgi:hypothetical protein